MQKFDVDAASDASSEDRSWQLGGSRRRRLHGTYSRRVGLRDAVFEKSERIRSVISANCSIEGIYAFGCCKGVNPRVTSGNQMVENEVKMMTFIAEYFDKKKYATTCADGTFAQPYNQVNRTTRLVKTDSISHDSTRPKSTPLIGDSRFYRVHN